MSELLDLVEYLDASPSPWHAAASATSALVAAGFEPLSLADAWSDVPDAGFVTRGAAVIAFRRPPSGIAPFKIVGAHTDSPCLRVKPRPDVVNHRWMQLGVEIYGGVLLNSWLDRDLGIAGRLVLRDGAALDVLVREPICRVPQLAIHLDRDVNDRGLVLDRQIHMTPVWGSSGGDFGDFGGWLAERAGVPYDEVASWELCLFDVTRAAVIGADASLLASGRLDNQISCWAAVDSLVASPAPSQQTNVIALFDHEEVGSDSTTGAGGPLLDHVLERLTLAAGGDRGAHLAALSGSSCVSADNAHAVHPNYPERHEPGHRPLVNHGPAIKVNSNQRYATSADTAAEFQRACDSAGVPWQVFVSRNNMPCGSTIGPITATRLGIATVDVGVPQLSMHSARELCGVHDAVWLADVLRTWFGEHDAASRRVH